jgi:hypothetical protein
MQMTYIQRPSLSENFMFIGDSGFLFIGYRAGGVIFKPTTVKQLTVNSCRPQVVIALLVREVGAKLPSYHTRKQEEEEKVMTLFTELQTHT